ncbi:hypothetical protein CS549_05890 [Porphyromonas gingivalis]|nr:hypothetical protein CS549_05890 [Porphyromonas gingivalis]
MQEIRGSTDVFVFEPRLEGKDVLFGRVPLAARPGQDTRGGTDRASEGVRQALANGTDGRTRKNV